jgi:formamidopyrimidine-DNA glycosylase
VAHAAAGAGERWRCQRSTVSGPTTKCSRLSTSLRNPCSSAASQAITAGRFTITFEDGGRLMLVDPRRLGRVRLNPPIEELGPDAQLITPAQSRAALAAGTTAPVRARIMDQRRIAGIGNLLAGEILWHARIHHARPFGSLIAAEQSRLLRASRDAIRAALRDGGVHTVTIIPHRRRAATCPRDHAPMRTSAIDGRTIWWCSAEQLLEGYSATMADLKIINSKRLAVTSRQ